MHIKALREITDSGNFNWKNHQHRYSICIWKFLIAGGCIRRELACCVLMTACDLCATCKPWEVNRRIVDDLFAEFHHQVRSMSHQYLRQQANQSLQGDQEKALGVTPIKMMDFNHKDKMPQFQVMKDNQNIIFHHVNNLT